MIKIEDCSVESCASPMGNAGVRVTHIPSGIIRHCNTEHTSTKNLKKALKFIEEDLEEKLKEDCLRDKTKIAFAHVMDVAIQEAIKRNEGNLSCFREADRHLIYREAFDYMWKLLKSGGISEKIMVEEIVGTISSLKIEGGKLKI